VFPRDRYAPPSGPRSPEFPLLVIPRLRMSRGAAIVVGVHVLIILLLLWRSADLLAGAGDGPGPRGGGGGGGRQALHTFLLTGAGLPQAVPIPPLPQFAMTKMPLPDPVKLDLPKVQPAPPVVTQVAAAPGTGNGTAGGPGEGPGTGGGKGEGTGTGVGNDSGPGHGGGPNILMASPKVTILPPACFRGHVVALFSVSADGQVTDVQLDPPPKDAGCRETMLKQLRTNQFYPAKTREGVPVTSVFPLKFSR
jgi:hypothetical protein